MFLEWAILYRSIWTPYSLCTVGFRNVLMFPHPPFFRAEYKWNINTRSGSSEGRVLEAQPLVNVANKRFVSEQSAADAGLSSRYEGCSLLFLLIEFVSFNGPSSVSNACTVTQPEPNLRRPVCVSEQSASRSCTYSLLRVFIFFQNRISCNRL
jgi:hypothetical protein